MTELEEWMKTHVKWVPKAFYIDPVYNCLVYKTEGCAHVDGFLCDYEKCEIRLDAIRKKSENFENLEKLKGTDPAPKNKKWEKRV
mgnify:CR=1 FL=1